MLSVALFGTRLLQSRAGIDRTLPQPADCERVLSNHKMHTATNRLRFRLRQPVWDVRWPLLVTERINKRDPRKDTL